MQPGFSPADISDDARRLRSGAIGAIGAIGADTQLATLAHEAVANIELQLLQRGWPVGEALGSIPDFQRMLGLGRPACHEAIIILEARGFLDVRRGRKGGLFVAAPTPEVVVGAMMMYLAISGASAECIQEFRLLMWRMVVQAAIQRDVSDFTPVSGAGQWGFAFELAKRIGNPAMTLAAQIGELLVRTCGGRHAPLRDEALEASLKLHDAAAAFRRLEALAGPVDLASPILALETVEHWFAGCERRLAMSLSARMTREIIRRPDAAEAEWQTAERLGYSDLVVRQARRILQDFGIVRCRKGSKGALRAAPAGPAGVIRQLTPCLMASGMTAQDGAEAFCVLATQAHSLQLAGNPIVAIMARSLGLANLPCERPVGLPLRAKVVVGNHRTANFVHAEARPA